MEIPQASCLIYQQNIKQMPDSQMILVLSDPFSPVAQVSEGAPCGFPCIL
jgi:hypothetical protein